MQNTPNWDGFMDGCRRGFSMIPAWPRTKVPCLAHHRDPDTGQSIGKLEEDTAGWKPYQGRPPTEEEIARWRRKWPNANPLKITGAISGLIVLDLDGDEAHRLVARFYGLLPETVTVETPGGSNRRHYWYMRPDDLGEYVHGFVGSNRDLPGVDLRADGCYAVYPGALHKSGRRYHFLAGHSPDEVAVVECPFWLRVEIAEYNHRLEGYQQRMPDLSIVETEHKRRMSQHEGERDSCRMARRLRAYVDKMFENEVRRVESAIIGSRNASLFMAAAHLSPAIRDGHLTRVQAEQALENACYVNGLHRDDGGVRGIRQTIASGLRAGSTSQIRLSDNSTRGGHIRATGHPARMKEILNTTTGEIIEVEVEYDADHPASLTHNGAVEGSG